MAIDFDDDKVKLAIRLGIVGIIIFVVAVIALTIGLVVGSINFVDYDEYGIVWDSVTGVIDVSAGVYEGGRHFLAMPKKFLKYDRFFQTLVFSDRKSWSLGSYSFPIDSPILETRTKDAVPMDVEAIIFYTLKKDELIALHMDFGQKYEQVFVKEAKHAIYDVVSTYPAQKLQSDRVQFVEDCMTELRKRFEPLHATIDSMQLGDIDLADNIEAAISYKLIAEQQAIRETRMRDVYLKRADIDIVSANGDAKIRTIQATTDSSIKMLQATTNATVTQIKASKDAEGMRLIGQEFNITKSEVLKYMWLNQIMNAKNIGFLINLSEYKQFDVNYATPSP